MNMPTPVGYAELLSEIKEQVRAARVRAGLAVNSELIMLYWRIGRDILDRQEALGWGSEVISRLADDLRREFPNIKGFSARNLKYMRQLAKY